MRNPRLGKMLAFAATLLCSAISMAEVHMGIDTTDSQSNIFFKSSDVNDPDAQKLNDILNVAPVDGLKTINSPNKDLYINCLSRIEPLFCSIVVKKGSNACLSFDSGNVRIELFGSAARSLTQFLKLPKDEYDLHAETDGNGTVDMQISDGHFLLTAHTRQSDGSWPSGPKCK